MERRLTNSKVEVLEALKAHGAAMSHDMIEAKVGSYNRTTIYRILNRFCEDGVLHKIVDENGKQFFALCETCEHNQHFHNHLHFKCTSCNLVECLDSELQFSLPKGYEAESFNAMVSGLCFACQN